MPASWRHHYIPQFYLRGFTNNSGRFFVFDKTTRHIKRGSYSPKTHFFEANRNTIGLPGADPYVLEKFYSEYDTTVARLFERLNASPWQDIDLRMIQDLKMFVAMLFWRLPSSDKAVPAVIQKLGFKGLGFQIKDKLSGQPIDWPEFEYLVTQDPEFSKAVRFLVLPLATFDLLIEEYDVRNWAIYRAATDITNLHLCSDNPLVIESIIESLHFKSAFAFPISSKCFVYYSPTGIKPRIVTPDARIELDSLVFRQALQYVCGPNREYLQSIAELSRITGSRLSLEDHTKYLFSILGTLAS